MATEDTFNLRVARLLHESKRINITAPFQLALITGRIRSCLKTGDHGRLAALLVLLLVARIDLPTELVLEHVGPATLQVALLSADTAQGQQVAALAHTLLMRLDGTDPRASPAPLQVARVAVGENSYARA